MNDQSKKTKKPAKPGQLNFTMKVAATDLPISDPKFKMKLIMDFGPEFNSDLTSPNPGPNFNAKRVRSILSFVSDEVIRKIVEFVNYKNYHTINGKPARLIYNQKIKDIYEKRQAHLGKGKPLESSPDLSQDEAFIAKIVNELINNEKREIEIQEKNIATIRFEDLNPEKLWADAQMSVNGDMPPPKRR